MRGWRARIGVIYPADGIIDEEFWKLAPPGVSVLLTRITVPEEPMSVQVVTNVGETEEIEQASKALKITRANAIAYACTSGSFVKGMGWDREIVMRIEKASGTKATTTSTAVIDALRILKIRKVAVAAPYPDDVNKTLTKFLQQNGFEVVAMKGLGLKYGWDIGNTPQSAVYQHAKSADSSEADGILIPCTAFPTLEIIESLEEDLGKPVVSANQATMWKAAAFAEGRRSLNNWSKIGSSELADRSCARGRSSRSASGGFWLYLNEVEWGPGVYGTEPACHYYYQSSARNIDRERSARLAAILPSPLRRRPERMNHYSELILERMRQMSW